MTPQSLGLQSENLSVKTKDEITLNGYWIESNQDTTRGLMILVHGIGGCKEHFLGLSQSLADRGIASVLFDGRAHGKSEGEYCTYGFQEKQDISQIIDFIKSKTPELKIGIWGNSLGGAISTFTKLDQIVFDYFNKGVKGFGIKYLSDYALGRAGTIADFDAKEIQPIVSVQNIAQPVLIAHGDSDANISVTYGQELFAALKSIDKEFIEVEDGGHFDLFQKGGSAYKDKLMHFIDSNLK